MAGLLGLLAVLAQAETIEDWIRRLADPSIEARDRAAAQLRAAGDRAIPALEKVRTDADEQVRVWASDVLERILRDQTLDPHLLGRYPNLRQSMESGDVRRALEALQSKDRWRWDASFNAEAYVISALERPEISLRRFAVGLLWQMPESSDWRLRRKPVDKLVRLIETWEPADDEHSPDLWGLVEATARVSSPYDRERMAAAKAGHDESRTALLLLRANAGIPESQERLATLLEKGTARVRRIALEIVARRKCESARGAVLRLLADRDVGWEARRALLAIADESCRESVLALFRGTPLSQLDWTHFHLVARLRLREAVPDLIALLQHRYTEAAEALVEMDATEAFPHLFARIGDEKVGLTCAYAAAALAGEDEVARLYARVDDCPNARSCLFQIRMADGQRMLLELLKSETRRDHREWIFRAITSSYFLRAGGEGVEDALERISGDSSDPLCAEAKDILRWMRGAVVAEPTHAETIPEPIGEHRYEFARMVRADQARARDRLLNELKNESTTLQDLLPALKEWAPAEASERLRAALRRYDGGRAEKLEDQEHIMTCGTGSMYLYAESGADWIDALVATGDRDEIPLLLSRLYDPERDIQHAAIRGLGTLGATEAGPMLRRIIRSSDSRTRGVAIRALLQLKLPGTTEFLIEQLRDNPVSAAHALARLNAKEAIPYLEALLKDDGSPVPVLGALDFLRHPDAYRGIDRPLPELSSLPLTALPRIFEKHAGGRWRLSPTALARARACRAGVSVDGRVTARDVLESLANFQNCCGKRLNHVVRGDFIEITEGSE